ncbi:type 2 periplasmic-binding domain-containing protein [Sphingomonas prati]|uniref:hypothetical protein n=1 Tax=Sphingomonas prati TaxID=1843237 RepID=UPI0018DFB798|nr:hypothetical protein [Sphingomonas prati]
MDGIDVAIRLGVGPLDDFTSAPASLRWPKDWSSLPPAPLTVRGTPANPSELADYDRIVQHGPFGRESWRFRRSGPSLPLMFKRGSE